MIEAEIRGKLPEARNSEDSLTSTVFGFLKFSAMRSALSEFLGNATLYSDDSVRLRSALTSSWPLPSDGVEFKFWERHGSFGAPDVLIVGPDFALVVEVKLGAELSGADQLRKYCALLTEQFNRKAHQHVIYLTTDLTPPVLSAAETFGIERKLWWLSWYELFQALDHNHGLPKISTEMAADLKRLLQHRGLSLYQGITRANIPEDWPYFWEDTLRLISNPGRWLQSRKLFWQEAGR